MKNAVALIAVAGLTCVAAAQDFSLTIDASATEVAEGGTFTLTVFGDANVGTHILGGSYGLESNSALVSNMTWTPAGWDQFPDDGGYAGNGNYNQVIFGQLLIPGLPPFDVPGPGSELGGEVGSFQVTLGAGTGVIDFQLTEQQPFSLQTIDMNTGALPSNADAGATLSLGSVRVNVVPAPSALALLGLGGVAAGRRRRSSSR